MRQQNVRVALATLRNARGRSLLTMFGIIVGVVAVIVTIAVGQGVKQQVVGQVNQLSKDIVVVRPGQSQAAASVDNGIFSGLQTSPFTNADVQVVSQTPGIKAVIPLAVGRGFSEVNGKHLPGSVVVATNNDLPLALDRKIEFGTFFTEGEMNRNVAVIGNEVAHQLFGENVPVGRTLTIRGEDYIVRGIFEGFATTPGSVGTDLNKAVFIPMGSAMVANNGELPVAQILVQLNDTQQQSATIAALTQRLQEAHGGQRDFTVLNRQQELAANNQLVSLLTQLVVAIASISLLVGGIGIINIMFVSVSERTREIGIRKAVGATNRQIASQFLVEAATLSVVGGLIGVSISLIVIFMLNVTTNLQPVIPYVPMVGVLLITWALGIIFGVAPAIKAARKEPIDALRYE